MERDSVDAELKSTPMHRELKCGNKWITPKSTKSRFGSVAESKNRNYVHWRSELFLDYSFLGPPPLSGLEILPEVKNMAMAIPMDATTMAKEAIANGSRL